MNLEQWFEKALSTDEYIESMKSHKEDLKAIYNEFEVPDSDEEFFAKIKEENLRVIAITEDWCTDAMLNIPILLKIAEKTGMEVRMILRDSNLELMDQYLTNGKSRSIPIFIFIDEAGQERAVWGPRAETIQQYVDEGRAALPEKDDPEFETRQKEFYAGIKEKYVTDRIFWNDVYESIKKRLLQ